MNKNLLLSLALASAGSFIAPQAWADVTTEDLQGMSDVATFRMKGTEGTEIKLTLDKIYSYTPTATGDVTFIYNKGVVSVYEGLTRKSVLSGTNADYTFEEPTADDATVGGKQLLQNASFETLGDKLTGDNYKFGEPWLSNVTPNANAGIRISKSTKAKEGNYVLIWRGSGNANYISQKIAVAPNKVYKVVCRQVDAGNANADFNVGIGTEAGKIDIANRTVRLGTSITNPSSQSAIISTYGATIDGDTYFTLSNISTASVSDPCTHLDYISLVEGALVNPCSLTGATDATLENGVEAAGDFEKKANKPYVEAYNKMKETYVLDASSKLDGLTWANSLGTKSSQYWDGNAATKYFDQWSGSAFNKVTSTSVVLPAGKYALVCAARASAENIASMKVGEKSVEFPLTGDVGMGITTDGEASFDNSKTYNNDNKGRGWQYIFVEFESDGSTATPINFDVHLQANTWISYCDVKLYAEKDIANIKESLENLIETATANASEGGTEAFFKDNTELNAAITDAKTAKESSDYTIVEKAYNALKEAYDAFKTAALIAPKESQAYKLILANNGCDRDEKAVTTMAGNRTDMGGYNMQYLAISGNNNYATAFFFVPVDGGYKLMFVDAEGKDRYICTAKKAYNSGNTSQLRTTTDADKALVVEVRREGVNLKLWNTEAKQYIGSDNDGFYTTSNNTNFKFEETTANNEIKYTMAAEYGTLMLPYAAKIPEGLTVYSCATTTDAQLNTEAVEKIEANVPYLVKGTKGETYSFSGVNTAFEPSYKAGVFTGVFVSTTVPKGSYVLQDGTEGLGFYMVDSNITLKANRCYLTATAAASAGVKAFFFDGDATGIESVEAADATVNVYSVNGTLVRANVKASEALNGLAAGVYVVNGQKKMVK